MHDVDKLLTLEFPAVKAARHSVELPAISFISKNFAAYVEALVGATECGHSLLQDDGPEEQDGHSLRQGSQ